MGWASGLDDHINDREPARLFPCIAPSWQYLVGIGRCCQQRRSGAIGARVLGPGRTQLVKEDSSSILRSVEENSVAAYGTGNRNCVAVARTDDRNQICDDLSVLGEAAWLTEATGATYRMIMPAGRHSIGVLKSDISADASGRSMEFLELCGCF